MAATAIELQNWCDASQNLTKAIQQYLDASLALEITVAREYDTYLKWSGSDRDALCDAILAEQAVIESRNTKLERAKNAINKPHNCSAKIVPIRTLPDEILARVFALSCEECTFFSPELLSNDVRLCYKFLLLITKVCSDWRRIAVNTPSLWSHVDIISHGATGKQPRTAELWLDRARSAPLHIQILFEQMAVDDYNVGTLDWLIPHLGSISSFALQSTPLSNRWLRVVAALWVKNGTPGSVKRLFLHAPAISINPGYSQPIDDAFSELDPDRIESFLIPIQILCLRHVHFQWTSPIYHNLVRLELFHIPRQSSPTLRQLADILSSSPGLRALTLSAIWILPLAAGDAPLPPIRLKALETMDVWSLMDDPHSRLFPILRLESSNLSVSINGNFPPHTPLEGFDVKRLLLHIIPSAPGASQLSHIPPFANLTALVIKIGFGIDRHTCHSISEQLVKVSRSDSSPRWPKLHTIWFFGGVYSINTIKEVAKAYNIRTLMITNVKYPLHSGEPLSVLRPFVEELIIENGVNESRLSEWQSRM